MDFRVPELTFSGRESVELTQLAVRRDEILENIDKEGTNHQIWMAFAQEFLRNSHVKLLIF